MDLVKEILCRLAETKSRKEQVTSNDFEGYDPELVSMHMEMMEEAGLIKGYASHSIGSFYYAADRLTWYGNDFLDASRNDKIWNKAKKVIVKAGGIFSIEVLKKLLNYLAIEYLKEEGDIG